MNISGKHYNSNFVHLFECYCLTDFVKILLIYSGWFAFGMCNDVNFQFTSKRVVSE